MKRIAIDIETSGLRPWGGKIYCVAINDGNKVWIETNPEKLKNILEDESIMKVIHNAGFDATWLKLLHGVTVRNIWDTRLVEQVILGCNLPRTEKSEEVKAAISSSLKYTLVRYGFPDLDKGMGHNFATRDRNAPLTNAEKQYAMNDVRYLLDLQQAQEYVCNNNNLIDVALLENKVVEVVAGMRARGIGFDTSTWLSIAEENEHTRLELMKRLPSGINWNSPKQIKDYFAKRGIVIGSLTDLEDIANHTTNAELDRLVKLRGVEKSVTTYGRSWLTINDQPTVDGDSRVRCDFEQILNTGRFSSSQPNLQQLPRDGKHRTAFVPKKGHVFIDGDFSGQEIGIMAAASGEDIWIDAMLRGDDVHSLTASLLYATEWSIGAEKDCAFPKKCKCPGHQPPRERAKALNFMLAYGGGPQKFSKLTGLSERESKKTIFKYKKVIPKLSRWLDRNGIAAVRDKVSYSADPYKRRRIINEPEEWMYANIGKNNPVQACGANMLKLAMISMPEEYPIVIVIHDQIILEVPKAKAKAAAKALKIVMEKAATFCTGIEGLIKVQPTIKYNLAK